MLNSSDALNKTNKALENRKGLSGVELRNYKYMLGCIEKEIIKTAEEGKTFLEYLDLDLRICGSLALEKILEHLTELGYEIKMVGSYRIEISWKEGK